LSCEKCKRKYNTEDCPKSYADDFREGLQAIRKNMDKCYDIFRRIEG